MVRKIKSNTEYRISNTECRSERQFPDSKFKIFSRSQAFGKSKKSSAGFTLLEVLVALALLGMAVTAVLQLFSANLRSISASEEYVAGSLEAQAKMKEVLEDKDVAEGTRNGITDNGYRFQVSVSDSLTERSESLSVKLMEVEVKVYWTQGNKDKSLTLKTLKMVQKPV